MKTLKTAVFGTGFVGRVHLEGIRRLGYVQLYAIGEPQIEKANQLAAEFGVEKTEATIAASWTIRPWTPSTSARPTRCTSRWPRTRCRPAST